MKRVENKKRGWTSREAPQRAASNLRFPEHHRNYKLHSYSEVLTDVIDGTSTKPSEELLGTEGFEVVNDERPQVKDVVPGDPVPLFHNNDFSTKQLSLDRRPQATRASANHQHLNIFKQTESFNMYTLPIKVTRHTLKMEISTTNSEMLTLKFVQALPRL